LRQILRRKAIVYKIINQNCGSIPNDLSGLTDRQLQATLQTATNILDTWKYAPVAADGGRARYDQSRLAKISKQTHRERPLSGL